MSGDVAAFAERPASMRCTVRTGALSELVLVRMHGRTADYLEGSDAERARVVDRCRREATVPDLAERILNRTIYAQSSARIAPLRELLQNAIDASPYGARIDVRSTADDTEILVIDRGRGMSAVELLEDLLVPFRSAKEADFEAIGEHGIGFLSALEIAPRIEITTATALEASRLVVTPIGARAPYPDFAFALDRLPVSAPGLQGVATGTTVKLSLDRPIPRAALAAEIGVAARLVDLQARRIYVDDQLVNGARARLRRVARASIAGGAYGEIELFAGRVEGAPPSFAVTQRGLLVSARPDPFSGGDLAIHRDLARAMAAAGTTIVVDLPLAVPLNKGRTAPIASVAPAVDEAIITAFERFVVEDALYDRDLLRGVDHRLASVLDRLVVSALAGEPPVDDVPAHLATEGAALSSRAPAIVPANDVPPLPKAPTVAAPEQVVRFARALLDAPMFQVVLAHPTRGVSKQRWTLRRVLSSHRAGALRPTEDQVTPGSIALSIADPLAQALWRRLEVSASPPPPIDIRRSAPPRSIVMQKVERDKLGEATALPGVPALAAALSVLERIDASISAAASLARSPITAHQDLYGPDEMAHTDGTGISVNLASPRVRALLSAVLSSGDQKAFAAIVDLLLHEKAHVSLATFVPRSTAEHGASFYRRKEALRRKLLEAIAEGTIPDPMRWVAIARRGLASPELPAPEALAIAFSSPSEAA